MRECLGDIEPEITDGCDDPNNDGLGDGVHADERGVTASPGDSLLRCKRIVHDRSHRPTLWSEPDNRMTSRHPRAKSS
jgi:hypothetical protein